jgi:hypothetical protein
MSWSNRFWEEQRRLNERMLEQARQLDTPAYRIYGGSTQQEDRGARSPLGGTAINKKERNS